MHLVQLVTTPVSTFRRMACWASLFSILVDFSAKDHTNTAQHCTVFVWSFLCLFFFCAKVYLLICSTFNVLCQASTLKGYLKCTTERIERSKRQGTVLSVAPLLGTHWQVEGKGISKHSTHISLKDSNPLQHVAWFQGKVFQGPLEDCT